jgi:putative membrane protein
MLWLKSFHVIFVVTWFAGLFYLPRLFVYTAMTDDENTRSTLLKMQRKLLGITNVGGALAVIFGVWMVIELPAWLSQSWIHWKMNLVILLIAYHVWCIRLVRRFARGETPHSHVWFRWFNEVPAVLLIGIVLLVVFKPF